MLKFHFGKIKFHILKFFSKFYLFLTGAVCLFILGFGFYNFVWPAYQDAKINVNSDLEETKERVEALQSYLNDLKDLRDSYDKFSTQQIQQMKDILPESKDFPALFVVAQDIGERNGLVIDGVSFSELSGDSGVSSNGITDIREVDVSLQVSEGNYSDLKNYLSDLEHHLRLFDITSISFSDTDGPYTINMKTYFMP